MNRFNQNMEMSTIEELCMVIIMEKPKFRSPYLLFRLLTSLKVIIDLPRVIWELERKGLIKKVDVKIELTSKARVVQYRDIHDILSDMKITGVEKRKILSLFEMR